jgi:hypothetical protein
MILISKQQVAMLGSDRPERDNHADRRIYAAAARGTTFDIGCPQAFATLIECFQSSADC